MESSRPNLHLWDIEYIVLRVLQLRATAELVLTILSLNAHQIAVALATPMQVAPPKLGTGLSHCRVCAPRPHECNISTMYPTRYRWGTHVTGSAAPSPHLGQRVNETLLVCGARHTVVLGHCIHVFAVHGHSCCIVPIPPTSADWTRLTGVTCTHLGRSERTTTFPSRLTMHDNPPNFGDGLAHVRI